MKGVILLFITGYRKFISPFLPKSCRFYPTCSEYTFQAVKKYGVKRGLSLGIKRIIRCNPFNEGGYDPLPKE
ncbi:MAG: membrane protein insertion efficiency factor YidD [Firmicutes bacterium]|nr:membrane protein insertion efficiency factor YidD [Bacillota bacterium]